MRRAPLSGAAIELRNTRPEAEEVRDAMDYVLFDKEQKVKKNAGGGGGVEGGVSGV